MSRTSSSSGYLVTGTDTGVGKTVVASLLAAGAHQLGLTVAVFKPAVTGLSERQHLPDHELLRLAAGSTQASSDICPYRLDLAASPALAANEAGVRIDPAELETRLQIVCAGAESVVVEGVGGFLVPLCDNYLVRDFATAAGLPVIVVARAGLGTINHTLLTVEAVQSLGLKVAAVVLNRWPEPPGLLELSNLETVKRLAGVPVLCLPELENELLAEPTPQRLVPLYRAHLETTVKFRSDLRD